MAAPAGSHVGLCDSATGSDVGLHFPATPTAATWYFYSNTVSFEYRVSLSIYLILIFSTTGFYGGQPQGQTSGFPFQPHPRQPEGIYIQI